MLVITGPGRSGTSMLGRFCGSIGYHPGGEWCEAIDAGLEHPRIVAINDAMYREARATGSVNEALARYRSEMVSFDLAVVKDPRFTYHPAILRAWSSVRPDLTVLLTYRNPQQSIASRKRHKKFLFVKHKARPEMLKCDMADSIEAMLDCDVPFSILLFPNFLTHYDDVYTALTGLGLRFDRNDGLEKWVSIADESRVHFKRPVPIQQTNSATQPQRGLRYILKRLAVPLLPRGLNAVAAIPLLAMLCLSTWETSWQPYDYPGHAAAGSRPVNVGRRAHTRISYWDPDARVGPGPMLTQYMRIGRFGEPFGGGRMRLARHGAWRTRNARRESVSVPLPKEFWEL